MIRFLYLASLFALALSSETGRASDVARAADESQPRQETTTNEESWYVDFAEARDEARKSDKPLMIVFR
jgi:thioredoxin-related protein